MIGQEVNIRDTNGHPVNAEARRNDQSMESSEIRPVVIEDDVWIGTGSTIGPGISIGKGSVIAANSVIYSNVPPYSIMGGNPARKMGSTQEASD
jgi:acetyltransferase-like isoleucine patch superfamily enzyme